MGKLIFAAIMVFWRGSAAAVEEPAGCERHLSAASALFPSGFRPAALEFDPRGSLLELDGFLSSRRDILWELSRGKPLDLPGYIRALHEATVGAARWASHRHGGDLPADYFSLILQHDHIVSFTIECTLDRLGNLKVEPALARELLAIRETPVPGSSLPLKIAEALFDHENFSEILKDEGLKGKILREILVARARGR